MKALPASSASSFRPGSRVDSSRYLRVSYDHFGALAILSDIFAVVGASVTIGGAYHLLAFGRTGSLAEFLGVGTVSAALTVALMKLKGLYVPDRLSSLRSQVSPIIFIWGCVLLLLLGLSFTLKISEGFSRGYILSLAATAPLLLLFQRYLLGSLMRLVLKYGWLRRRKVVLITDGLKGTAVGDEALYAYDIVGTYVLPAKREAVRTLIGSIINRARGSEAISEILLATDWSRWADVKDMLAELRALPIPVRLIADMVAREVLQHPHRASGGVVTFELQRAPLGSLERTLKRLFDVTLATAALLAMAPLLLAVSILVWIESPGPVLFRQRRGGFNGRAFEILKFRTMRVTEDGPVITQATRQDQRVTRVGRWLRRSSVDELPQLINVLRGDMSLVGPRPHALAHDDQYSRLISDYPHRHHVRPGITGWAQVNRLRGETPTLGLMQQRVDLDLWYVTNWSFWLDLWILLKTVVEVCRSQDAF